MAGSVVRKGSDFISAMAFQFAATKLHTSGMPEGSARQRTTPKSLTPLAAHLNDGIIVVGFDNDVWRLTGVSSNVRQSLTQIDFESKNRTLSGQTKFSFVAQLRCRTLRVPSSVGNNRN
ncbi:hypothetical protein PQR52_11460 [Paraburkholderia aspalathi]|uniref:hypothetical protein n=1 Tax=Paraburkholderia aspalathi TaxID=1324617 RepID=UPI0038B82162